MPRQPVQFTITTLQPRWKQTEQGSLYIWNHCLSSRFWCAILARFGVWTICGRVTTCGQQPVPLAGVLVSAFDADWLQDDTLGTALTDGSGKFQIDYVTEAFQKTPFSFINLELVGGPDLYFKIQDAGGTLLRNEPSSRGRANDRENAGNCFCVELCVDTKVAPPFDNPLFTHIGDFHIYGDINPATGLTNSAVALHGGPNYGFFGGMKLKGFCPKTSPIGSPQPMRYRFRYARLDAPAVLIPITGSRVAPAIVGSRMILWKVFDDTLAWTFQSIMIAGAGATPDPTPTPPGPGPWGAPPTHVIVPDSDGWIAVDQNALDGGFYGALIRLNSAAAIPGGVAPGSGAGIAPADPKNGVPIKIIFEAGPIGGPVTFSNEVSRVLVNNWVEVSELNLLQFHSAGGSPCAPVANAIDIEYTADHELMAEWGLTLHTAAMIPGGTPVLPSGTTPRGGIGTHHLNITGWPSCSYRIQLMTRRALTNGEVDDDADVSSLLTFCI